MFFVEFHLFFAAAFGFVDGGFHGVGDFVGIQNRDAVHVARGAAYGLNQAAVGRRKPSLSASRMATRRLRGCRGLRAEIDTDEYVKQSEP